MEWQPIETAPKNETRILVCATLRGASLGSGRDVAIAWWDAHYEIWVTGFQNNPEPTHWMPLPEPPKG